MQSSSGNPAVRWGVIFGIILVVVDLLSTGLRYATGGAHSFASTNAALTGVGCIFTLIGLAVLFVAGIFAARDTGRVGTGAVAGLIAGVIGGIIAAIVGVIVLATLPANIFEEAIRQSASGGTLTPTQVHNLAQVSRVIAYIGTIIGILVEVGLGAGLGALGGLIGKGQYRGPVAAYQSSMYQGMGQMPGQPPAPGYPQQPQGYSPPPPPQYPQQENPGTNPPPPPPQYPQQ